MKRLFFFLLLSILTWLVWSLNRPIGPETNIDSKLFPAISNHLSFPSSSSLSVCLSVSFSSLLSGQSKHEKGTERRRRRRREEKEEEEEEEKKRRRRRRIAPLISISPILSLCKFSQAKKGQEREKANFYLLFFLSLCLSFVA